MCGILGQYFFNKQETDSQNWEKALKCIEHRGPDNQTSVSIENGHLGHVRLAIIDLDKQANQPFYSHDKSKVLVFNGEIYNYLELKKRLPSNIPFSSNSDTEVLLYWLEQYGFEGLKYVNGFYALCYIDLNKQSGFIARDVMGIKPLAYSICNQQLTFSSGVLSVKTLLGNTEVDLDALGQYLQHTYIPAPKTFYKNIQKLMPGEVMTFERSGEHTFHQIIPNLKSEGSLSDLMRSSVKLRLQSDVPVGTFLSGGIDSSIISALAAKEVTQLKTYSVGFEKNSVFDESRYAEKVAQHIGSDHTTIHLSEDELLKDLDRLIDCMDEPFSDSSSVAVYSLSARVRKDVKVILSGDGADELFAGYQKHKALARLIRQGRKEKFLGKMGSMLPLQGSRQSKIGNKIRQLKKWGNTYHLDPKEAYLQLASFTPHSKVQSILNRDYKHYNIQNEINDLRDVLALDQTLVLPNDMLTKVDRMTMAHGLEARVPFLDVRIVQWAQSVKEEKLISKLYNKPVLKDAFSQLLPEWVFTRKKHGFEVPIQKWLTHHLKEELMHLISKEVCEKHGLIDHTSINSTYDQLMKPGSGDSVYTIWSVFILHKWLENYA